MQPENIKNSNLQQRYNSFTQNNDYPQSIYDTVIEKDIVKRYKLRQFNNLRRIYVYLELFRRGRKVFVVNAGKA